MGQALKKDDLQLVEKLQLLQVEQPQAFNNLKYLVDGILLGMNLNKDKRKGE